MNTDQARTILLEHARSNRNGVFPARWDFKASLTNPLCGDHVELQIESHNQEISFIGHKARACAVCSASASLLCQETTGLTHAQALGLGDLLESTLLGPIDSAWPTDLQKLACFEHLKVNTARKMCALLPWLALRKALRPQEQV